MPQQALQQVQNLKLHHSLSIECSFTTRLELTTTIYYQAFSYVKSKTIPKPP